MAELKPCKCGQDRFIYHAAIGYKVVCKCGCNTKGFYKTKEEAIEAWNKMNKDAVAISECPFNCKYNILHIGEVIVAPTGVKRYYISCKCGAKGPEKDTEQDAIVAWNTRG